MPPAKPEGARKAERELVMQWAKTIAAQLAIIMEVTEHHDHRLINIDGVIRPVCSEIALIPIQAITGEVSENAQALVRLYEQIEPTDQIAVAIREGGNAANVLVAAWNDQRAYEKIGRFLHFRGATYTAGVTLLTALRTLLQALNPPVAVAPIPIHSQPRQV